MNRPFLSAALALIALGAWGLWPDEDSFEEQHAATAALSSDSEARRPLRSPSSADASVILARAGIRSASFISEDWDPFEEQEAWRQRSAPSASAPIEFAGVRKLGTGDFVTDRVPLRARKEKK